MNYILAIICSCVTGVAIGFGIGHKSSPVIAAPSSSPTNTIAGNIQTAENASPQTVTQSSAAPSPIDSSQVSALQSQLEALLSQQEIMQNQQAELNRELNAIQFRLDTHSESFRPLRSERMLEPLTPQSTPPGMTPLLPPLR